MIGILFEPSQAAGASAAVLFEREGAAKRIPAGSRQVAQQTLMPITGDAVDCVVLS
jgi:hypothetical protein